MVKKKKKQPNRSGIEPDSTFFLKMVLYLIVGAQWLRITWGQQYVLPIPVGLLLDLVFVRHEHFQIDRKIEYALLLVAMFVGFWLPIGIVIQL